MPSTRPRPRTVNVLAILVMTASMFAAWSLWPASPPQLDGGKDVFDAVDALFTAVRSRDERLLDRCQEQLRGYENDGKLSPEAARYLGDVVEMARGGKSRPAAEKLYQFMKAQRRTT